MGYACPVCDEPQQDAEHLANHLAFQAMTHGDDHESWLDEHAPEWTEGGTADLAPQVAAVAEETAYDVVFDDTTPDRDDGAERYDPDLQGEMDHPEHGHVHGHGHSHEAGRQSKSGDVADLEPEARRIVEDAQELTRAMLDSDGENEGKDETVEEADGRDVDET